MHIYELSKEGNENNINDNNLFIHNRDFPFIKSSKKILSSKLIDFSLEETTKINLKNQILMSKDIELNVCKTWKNFCAIGDAKGNIVILDRIVEKKSRRKEANNISK